MSGRLEGAWTSMLCGGRCKHAHLHMHMTCRVGEGNRAHRTPAGCEVGPAAVACFTMVMELWKSTHWRLQGAQARQAGTLVGPP